MEPEKIIEEIKPKKKATTKKVASSSKASSTKKTTSKTATKTTKKTSAKTTSKKADGETKKKSSVKKDVKEELVEKVEEKEKVQVKSELNDLMKLLDSKKNSQKINKTSGSLDEQTYDHKEILRKKMDAQKKLNEKNLDEKQSVLPKPLPKLEDIMGSADLEEELVNEELENLRKENERLNAEVKSLSEDVSIKEEKILVLTNSFVGKSNELELSRELEELKKQNELLKEELDKKNIIIANNQSNDLNTKEGLNKVSDVKENLSSESNEPLLDEKVSNKEIKIKVSYDDKGELALRLRLLNDRIAEKDRQITLVENELNKLSEKDIVAESFTIKIKEVRKVRNEYVKQANTELEELAKLVKNNEEKVSSKKSAYDEKCKEIDAFEKEYKALQLSYLEKQEKIKIRTKLNAEKDSLFVIVDQAEENYKKLLLRYKNTLKQVEMRIQKFNDAESEIINLYLNQLRIAKTQENTDYLAQKEEKNNLMLELEALLKKIHGEDKEENTDFDSYDLNNLKNEYSKVLGKLHIISTKIKEREKVEKVLIGNEKVVKEYYDAFTKREIAIFNINENTSKLEILENNSQEEKANYIEKIKILIEDDKEKVDYFTKIIEKVKEDEKVIFFISLINSIAELQEALREYKKKEQSLKNIINELDK